MSLQNETLSTAENIEYPSAEQISATCNAALSLYNIAGGNFGKWVSTQDSEGAQFFIKPQSGQKFIPAEFHIDLPEHGTRGVDITRTSRAMTETGYASLTVITSLRPQLDPADQPEVITLLGTHDKDIFGEDAFIGVNEKQLPLTAELLSTLSEDIQLVSQSEGEEVVIPAKPSRFAKLVGKLATR